MEQEFKLCPGRESAYSMYYEVVKIGENTKSPFPDVTFHKNSFHVFWKCNLNGYKGINQSCLGHFMMTKELFQDAAMKMHIVSEVEMEMETLILNHKDFDKDYLK